MSESQKNQTPHSNTLHNRLKKPALRRIAAPDHHAKKSVSMDVLQPRSTAQRTTRNQQKLQVNAPAKSQQKPAHNPTPRSAVRHTPLPAQKVHTVQKKSVTLIRDGLPKPAATLKKQPRIVRRTDFITNKTTDVAQKTPQNLLQRAIKTRKSPVVAHFAAPSSQTGPNRSSSQKPSAVGSQTQAQPVTRKEALIASAMEATTPQAPRQRKLQSFTTKLTQKPRRLTMVGFSVAAIGILSYSVFVNIPNISLRVAASRAGFEANMPGYRPAGFAFTGPISYSPGQITIEYGTNDQGRSFKLTQRETNWDSRSLLDEHISKNFPLYQTFQERGLTIYVYEGSKAAWVNGGIWYTIDGDASLNAEQLIRIATSL